MIDKAAAFDQAFEAFKQALKDNFEVTAILDEERLMALFAEQLPEMISNYVEEDAASGSFVDELYGDDILEFVEFEEEE